MKLGCCISRVGLGIAIKNFHIFSGDPSRSENDLEPKISPREFENLAEKAHSYQTLPDMGAISFDRLREGQDKGSTPK